MESVASVPTWRQFCSLHLPISIFWCELAAHGAKRRVWIWSSHSRLSLPRRVLWSSRNRSRMARCEVSPASGSMQQNFFRFRPLRHRCCRRCCPLDRRARISPVFHRCCCYRKLRAVCRASRPLRCPPACRHSRRRLTRRTHRCGRRSHRPGSRCSLRRWSHHSVQGRPHP